MAQSFLHSLSVLQQLPIAHQHRLRKFEFSLHLLIAMCLVGYLFDLSQQLLNFFLVSAVEFHDLLFERIYLMVFPLAGVRDGKGSLLLRSKSLLIDISL